MPKQSKKNKHKSGNRLLTPVLIASASLSFSHMPTKMRARLLGVFATDPRPQAASYEQIELAIDPDPAVREAAAGAALTRMAPA